MTFAFQFAFESHMQENDASMARKHVRSFISSVQRVALALSLSHFGSLGGLCLPLGTPEAHTLARWICQSYRRFLGVELPKLSSERSESILDGPWHHSDAIICCSAKGFACLQGEICFSSMGRPVSYEKVVAWKVLNEEDTAYCISFMLIAS
ncbi:homeobox-leucine zipper protein ATHB-15-like isoform X2 [Solanum dulcamara]|uniref:homeobox-leucine zipper protein ATHB-15-like isoform X2 n=1 Tax=Solanum dulcamara TaxID=45834 RepID=UPI0024851242|nr:homeobox-leucine zipper protein ATHB-15-like isoform X2 [Solanum dulcamara]